MTDHKTYTIAEMGGWERFYRANFLNSISGFKPLNLIATVDAQGVSNLGLFSNIVHLGADPALVGFVNRPREAAPHTLGNIERSGFYTINHVHPEILARAHQCSAKYPDGVSEFTETGLTEEWVDGLSVPYVRESLIRYALELVQVNPIPMNGTFFVIGRVLQAQLDPSLVSADGFIDISRADSLVSTGLDAYGRVSALARYRYAKPDKVSEQIPWVS
ncbi:MAG: flavin reductase family protein [bacterium]|jgi:flavin reductase (DIM6/NTAB) family NADH-FMN oxidoreductase RutF|nr:flavin reductase [Chitinophagaceae bacterium]